jgi:Cu+-exporting ATPase
VDLIKQEKNVKMVIPVKGMTCATCAQSIEKALSLKQGVSSARVNYASEKAIVEFDSNEIKVSDINETIQDLGYEPDADSGPEEKEVILKIVGMTCSSCVQAVEKALNKVSGVITANVNLATEKARVKYDSRLVSILDLRQAVANTGYEVDRKYWI